MMALAILPLRRPAPGVVAWRMRPPVTPAHCLVARALMGPPIDLELHDAARHLGVMSGDLDAALWRGLDKGGR